MTNNYEATTFEQIAKVGDTGRIDHTHFRRMRRDDAVGEVIDIKVQTCGEFTYFVKFPNRKIACFHDDIKEVNP